MNLEDSGLKPFFSPTVDGSRIKRLLQGRLREEFVVGATATVYQNKSRAGNEARDVGTETSESLI